jgi:hypothetical protein
MSGPMGARLVTGQQLPPGTKLNVTFDWPANFYNGAPQMITVNGGQVQVAFEKIADL